ncbi:Mannosyl-oligosaccharide 1 [Diplonema papillatum]|nr:Mannosyl-oligosaccharide 1 [Diplonema papillatum]
MAWAKSLGEDCTATPPPPKHPLGGGDVDLTELQARSEAVRTAAEGSWDESLIREELGEDPCKRMDSACRQEEVKKAFLYSWNAYTEHAWGKDELKPVTKTFKNWASGEQAIGLTILDSMSTLHIMGLTEEFDKARQWVREEMNTAIDVKASQFEFVIRVVGGLLSAYELSDEEYPELLMKAKQVMNRLMPAYETSNGIPHASINLATAEHSNPLWTGGSSVLSEFGTVQLEMRTMSLHTQNSIYDECATWISDLIRGKAPSSHLVPVYFNMENDMWSTDHVTLGALGDSYYEYLLKQHLLTGKVERGYRVQYEKALAAILKKLVKKSNPSGQTYLAEFKRGGIYNKMDHLSCFAAGMFTLGALELGDPVVKNGASVDEVMDTAEGLAETCYKMYKSQPTGLAPELVMFTGGDDMSNSPNAMYNVLRPETVESFMYLYRATKKQKYRDWGWEIFRSFLRWSKVKTGGFTGLRDVGVVPPKMDDVQQSFWMAETLKYLYLLFASDEDPGVDFSEWVLNTEGHPLKIRKRDPQDLWSEEAREKRQEDLTKTINERLTDYSVSMEQRIKYMREKVSHGSTLKKKKKKKRKKKKVQTSEEDSENRAEGAE